MVARWLWWGLWNVVLQRCVHIQKPFLENVVTTSYETLSWFIYNVFTTLPERDIVSWDSNTEKLNCRHSFDTWNTETDTFDGEKNRNYWLHLDTFTLKS